MKKLLFVIKVVVVLLIVFFALFPRSMEVLSGNYLFGFDQGRDYLAVWDIVVNRKFTLIGSEWGAGSAGFSGLFHGPFYYYLLSIAFIAFQGDPYGGMVLLLLLSFAFLTGIYLFGRYIFDHATALVFVLLATIAPPFIAHARFIWNSHPSPIFILLAFFCIYQVIKTSGKKPIYIFLSAFFSGFIYNFQSGVALPVCLTLLLCALFVFKLRKIHQYILLLAGYGMAFSPILLFNTRHDFISFRGMMEYLSGSPDTAVTPMFIALLLRDHWNSFVFNFFDSFPPIPYVMQRLLFLTMSIMLLFTLRKERNTVLRRFIQFLLLLPIVTFGVFGFLRNAVYAYYLIHLNIVYIFLFVYIWYRAGGSELRFGRLILVICIVVMLWFHAPWVIKNTQDDYRDYGGKEKMAGKKDAIDYIYRRAEGTPFGLLVFSPPIYVYPYDYILLWYGSKKYGYMPYKDTKGTFYLLMERDANKPFSHLGWMETVVKTGTVIDTEELPSGFLVQKRVE